METGTEKMTSLAPIAVFAYNRPAHLQQTIEALRKNELALNSHLIIFSDGAKGQEDINKVEETRQYLQTISGFKSVKIYVREKNYGLAYNIIEGVTQVINEYGKIIVLEDDLISAPYFLKYANEALSLYEQEEQVISINSYMYPVKEKLPETFFIKGADCLGWATWKRGWDLFERDGAALITELRERNLSQEFDFDGSYPFTRMLSRQSRGQVGSWAIRWYASAFLKDKLTLYPGRSLIFHNGSDGSGTNVGLDSFFDVILSPIPILVDKITISENMNVRQEIAKFFRSARAPLAKRAWRRLKLIVFKKIYALNKQSSNN